MKKLLITSLVILAGALQIAVAQQQSVSIGTTNIDTDAVLLLVGNGNQGLIIPTTSAISGIPAKPGMVVYSTTDKKIYYSDGATWAALGGATAGATPVLTIDGNNVSIFSSAPVKLAGTAPTQPGQLFMWDGGKWTVTNSTAPQPEQYLKWSGTAWIPATLPLTTGTVTEVTTTAPLTVTNGTTTPALSIAAGGITNSLMAPNSITSSNITSAAINASHLSSLGATNSGQVLQWNGSAWAPASLPSTTTGNFSTPNTAIQITGGGNAVIGAGTTINIPNATITQTGLLSATDFDAFSKKGDMLKATYDTDGDNVVDAAATVNYASQSVNTVLAAPAANAGVPSFRLLTATDIPVLDAAKITTGTLPVVRGGTGVTTAPTNGQLLIGGTNGFSLGTLTAGTGITVTNTSGTITLATTAMTNPMTSAGDVIYGSGANATPTRLATGTGFLKGGATPSYSKVDLTSTNDITGTLPIASGGTNRTTAGSAGTVLYSDGTAFANTAAGTAGQVLQSNGVNAPSWVTPFTNPMTAQGDIIFGGASGAPTKLATGTGFLKGGATPSYSAVNLASTDVSGTLPIAQGGTNSTATPTDGGIAYGDGTAIAYTAGGTSGQMLQSNGVNAPTWGLVTGTNLATNIAISTTGNLATTGTGTLNIAGTSTLGGALNVTGVTTLTNLSGTGSRMVVASPAGLLSTQTIPTGTVTTVSVANANGFNGSVATATTTPAITLSTTVTGMLKGNGTALSAATAGTDYLVPFTSQTANTIFAAPDGSAGNPSFRTLANGDIPNLDASKITTGTLPIARGGTNSTATPTAGAIAYGTGTALAYTAVGTAGQTLISNAGGTPTWGAVSGGTGGSITDASITAADLANGSVSGGTGGVITDASITAADLAVGSVDLTTTVVTGTLPIAKGGTNLTTAGSAGTILYSDGTNLVNTAAGTAGQVLQSNGAAAPTWVAGGWGLTGNDITSAPTSFVGTSSNHDLIFKANNTEYARINASTGNLNLAVGGLSMAGTPTLQSDPTNLSLGRLAGGISAGNGDNTFVGNSSGMNNTSATIQNTFLGKSSGEDNATGTANTFLGTWAGGKNQSGSGNVMIGLYTGWNNLSGDNNVLIGNGTEVGSDGLSNAVAIGAGAIVTASNTVQLGDANVTTVNVGTGTTAKLVTGALQITAGAGTANQVLMSSDVNGNATWQNVPTAPLANGNIFVGNGSNVATSVAMSGDATIINTGVLTIANGAISGGAGGKITDASITAADLANSSVSGGAGGIITDASITAADLAASSVSGGAAGTITDASITTADLANSSVSGGAGGIITDASITGEDLAGNISISTTGSVTAATFSGDGSLLTNVPVSTAITNNLLPKSNGSTFVASTISENGGVLNVPGLANASQRMVVADATGNLQAAPAFPGSGFLFKGDGTTFTASTITENTGILNIPGLANASPRIVVADATGNLQAAPAFPGSGVLFKGDGTTFTASTVTENAGVLNIPGLANASARMVVADVTGNLAVAPAFPGSGVLFKGDGTTFTASTVTENAGVLNIPGLANASARMVVADVTGNLAVAPAFPAAGVVFKGDGTTFTSSTITENAGVVNISGLSGAGTRFVVADASGNLATSTGSGWNLQGNAGTDPLNDFIGTTDAFDFIIKSRSGEATGQQITVGEFGVSQKSRGTDDASLFDLGNSDASHKMVFYPGRASDPNPYIMVKGGDPLRFVSDAAGFTEIMTIDPSNRLRMLDHDILFRASPDASHGLGYRLNWEGNSIDGPVLYGYSGGALGTYDQSGPTEKLALYWNTSGSVGIGTATPASRLDVVGDVRATGGILSNDVNSAFGTYLTMTKSRAGTVVNNDDELGWMDFQGHDGTNFQRAAMIYSNVDGTPATGSVPGRLSFHTTPAGGSYLERMRITSTGNVGIGTTTPGDKLDVNGAVLLEQIAAPGTPTDRLYNVGGTLTWNGAALGGGWSLSGNSTGLTDGAPGVGTNYIGTTVNVPLNFMVFNTRAGRIDNTLNNVFLGHTSGGTATTGTDNVGIGDESLTALTTGSYNATLGGGALKANTTGQDNIAIGHLALQANTTGGANVAIGPVALFNNTVGAENIGIGIDALNTNVAGSQGIAIGNRSMQYANNTATPFTNTNVAVGIEALRGSTTASANTGLDNTAVGYQTLANNSSGYYNTALGKSVLITNTSGYENSGIGRNALQSNTTGYRNTALGSLALTSNIGGFSNTGIGVEALTSNTSGIGNAALGYAALFNNSTGSGNLAVGTNALNASSTGDNNTAVGGNSLATNATGSNNTALGYNADVVSGALTNATALGSGAIVNASNTIQLGNAAVTTVNVGTGTTAKLVAGALQITGGAGTANQVLTSDVNGNATWQNASGGGWSLSGNSTGLTDGAPGVGTNYIGTTVNVPVNFMVNNQRAGRIDGSGPVFLGYQAGNVNTQTGNTGIGYQALTLNTSGGPNTAVGYQSMYSNLNGGNNTALGTSALVSNVGSSQNTAIGHQSAYQTTGAANTAVGSVSLWLNSTGTFNTAVGYQALLSNTIGSYNVAVGWDALASTNTNGTYNTAIGTSAGVTVDGLTKATAIGYNAKVASSNSLVLGGTGADAVNVGIGTTSPQAALEVNSTGAMIIPDGTTAQKPAATIGAGAIRYNTDLGTLEYSDGTNWHSLVPAGTIVAYGGTSAPQGWLMCDGTPYNRTTYAKLFTAIGVAYGAPDGATFRVPDFRGKFLRGVDGGTGFDPDAASRVAQYAGGNGGNNVGSYQSDDFASHTHVSPSQAHSNVNSPFGMTNLSNSNFGTYSGASNGPLNAMNNTSTGGNETRPENIYVNYIIKY